MNKKGRIAVVTGGDRGLGFEGCRHLARTGLFVILTGKDRSKAEQYGVFVATEPRFPGDIAGLMGGSWPGSRPCWSR